MGISLKSHKMLWGRFGNRCAMTDCRNELVMDATETDDESLIGEECHIVAQKPNGPRGDPSFPKDKIDKYSNLILLCRIHHKLIDDQPNTYTVDKLHKTKELHEKWVRESLEEYDEKKQNDEELYATYIENWIELSHLTHWRGWTSRVLCANDPELDIEVDKSLKQLREWILTRIWPKRYTELENALENFRRILQDFQNLFHKHSTKSHDIFYTKKFYHIDGWNPDEYEMLLKRYVFHVGLVEDLVLELTRAANYICDKVREFIDPIFRLSEGALIVESGPYMDFTWRQRRAEYSEKEKTDIPYPGLEKFKKVRTERIFCFGVGTDVSDPAFLEWYRKR